MVIIDENDFENKTKKKMTSKVARRSEYPNIASLTLLVTMRVLTSIWFLKIISGFLSFLCVFIKHIFYNA